MPAARPPGRGVQPVQRRGGSGEQEQGEAGGDDRRGREEEPVPPAAGRGSRRRRGHEGVRPARGNAAGMAASCSCGSNRATAMAAARAWTARATM